ncbi:hypothetical protein [Raineyella sp.]|uniref:DUF3040 domain-containing protein n=1 Tax=bioreactor metagenome TaxID=1076179 RepID=A0A645AND4_9ZZZZ|nr:hypothetical protein [Raineyella sp.]MEA5155299.1 hypothetical protein [Raineyella sp.]
MTTQTFHLIDRRLGAPEQHGSNEHSRQHLGLPEHSWARRQSGLLRAGSACLTVAALGVVLGAFSANDALLSLGALVGVVGAFLLACRELTGPQRVEPGATSARVPDSQDAPPARMNTR